MEVVYLIRQTGLNGEELYKIGVTKNPIEVRLRYLSTGNPHKLDLQGSYQSPNYRRIESWLHRVYSSQKVKGEWFDLTPQQVLSFEADCIEIEKTISMLLEFNPFFN